MYIVLYLYKANSCTWVQFTLNKKIAWIIKYISTYLYFKWIHIIKILTMWAWLTVDYVTNLIKTKYCLQINYQLYSFLNSFIFIYVTYSRTIYSDGDIYEGGYNMDNKHGKGKMEYYSEDGRIEKGSWVKNKEQGEFEVIYKDGTTQKIMYKDGKRVKEYDAKD